MLNAGLRKEKLPEIAVLDKAGFERAYEAGSKPAGAGNWKEQLRKMRW